MMNDDAEQTCLATASGIMHCLRMLADEAASLNLSRTLVAIHEALQTCESEGLTPDIAGHFGLPRTCLH